tara:strand:- start:12463 stop:13026 length:564 start_codon:yes stop_codon:yes gene_type:complete
MQEIVILVRNSFILFVILLCTFSCSKLTEFDNQRIKEVLGDSLLSSSSSWDIDMDIIEDGFISLNLKSSKAVSYSKNDVKYTTLSGPVSIQIFEADTLQTEVFSDSALYRPSASSFELFGAVKVFTTSGRRLRTEYLKWERANDIISTNEYVTIVTPSDSINAMGLVGNADLTNYTLNEVTGQTVIH